jgi:hypothetical protein
LNNTPLNNATTLVSKLNLSGKITTQDLQITQFIGELASLNRSWQSKEGTYRALGMAGIEPTPSESKDWTPLSP